MPHGALSNKWLSGSFSYVCFLVLGGEEASQGRADDQRVARGFQTASRRCSHTRVRTCSCVYTHARRGTGGSAPGRVSRFKAPGIKPPNLTTWQGICPGLLCIFSSLASPGVHTSDSCTHGPAPAASLPGSRAWSRGPAPRSLLALTLDFPGREPLQASDRSPSLLVPVQLVCWEGRLQTPGGSCSGCNHWKTKSFWSEHSPSCEATDSPMSTPSAHDQHRSHIPGLVATTTLSDDRRVSSWSPRAPWFSTLLAVCSAACPPHSC